MNGKKLCWTLLLAGLAAAESRAAVISEELQSALLNLAAADKVAVIVRCEGALEPFSYSRYTAANRSPRLLRDLQRQGRSCEAVLKQPFMQLDADSVQPLWIINGLALRLPAAAVNQLAAVPGVARVSLDTEVRLPEPVLASISAAGSGVPEWNIEAVRAPELWALGYDGSGSVIASLDSGVDPYHPDMAAAWRGGSNSWYDPYSEHPDWPYDASGHGTWSMGLAVGGSSSGSAIGVAPGASWIAAKIFRDNGRGQLSRIHQAFQWLLDPDQNPASPDAPDVVLGAWYLEQTIDQCNQEFSQDIAILKALDIGVVFAAGNTGPGSSTSVSPSNNAGVVAVAASDINDNPAAFSARGPSACGGGLYPQLTAPGVAVLTTDLTLGGIIPNAYISVTGTSFAAPHVAAGVALLKAAFPLARLDQIEMALSESAFDLAEPGADSVSGYGLLDLVGAHTWLNDNPSSGNAGQLQFSVADYALSESAGNLLLQVNRVNGYSGEVSVIYSSVDGTAVAGQDYAASSGTLTFQDGQTTANISLGILDDELVEGDETFEVLLGATSGGAVLGYPSITTVTILDDEPQPQPGTLDFSMASVTVGENAGSLLLTVTRSGGSDGAVSVAYSSRNGSAVAGEDYVGLAGRLLLGDGQSSAGISLDLLDDSVSEPTETLSIDLANPEGGAVLGTTTTMTVSIEDDDTGIPGDSDGDGFTIADDCNDNDASVFPGATEIVRDGIDQDCNGYDLTIVIVEASYSIKSDQLTVLASSALGASAQLRVEGLGDMKWNKRDNQWVLSLRRIGYQPVLITVSGPEGSLSANVAAF